MDRRAKGLQLILVLALIAWLACAGYAGKRILDDQLSDTTVHSSMVVSATTPAGTFDVHQDTSSTVSGPANATTTGPENQLDGVVASASTATPAGTESESDGKSSTTPSSTTPADDDGGGGGPVISTDGPGGADVTFFAFLLLIGAGLFALLLRTLGGGALTADGDATPESSVGDDAIAILEAAARAKTAQRRAGIPPRDELSDLYARQAITAARETGELAERLATRLRAERRISAADASALEEAAGKAASVGATVDRGKLHPSTDLVDATARALAAAKLAGNLAIGAKEIPPAPAPESESDKPDGGAK
jgi:hypothetical protein